MSYNNFWSTGQRSFVLGNQITNRTVTIFHEAIDSGVWRRSATGLVFVRPGSCSPDLITARPTTTLSLYSEGNRLENFGEMRGIHVMRP